MAAASEVPDGVMTVELTWQIRVLEGPDLPWLVSGCDKRSLDFKNYVFRINELVKGELGLQLYDALCKAPGKIKVTGRVEDVRLQTFYFRVTAVEVGGKVYDVIGADPH